MYLHISPRQFADIGSDRWFALESDHEDRNDGANAEESDEQTVCEHPAFGGESGESHVKEDYRYLDCGQRDVGDHEGSRGNLF